MFLLYFLIFLIFLVLLYIIFLRKIPLKIIAKALNAQLSVDKQNGLFSFSSLNLKSDALSLNIANSNVSINPLGFLSSSFKILNVHISKISLGLLDVTKLKKQKIEKLDLDEEIENKNESKSENAISQTTLKSKSSQFKSKLFAQIGYYCTRIFEINIDSIEVMIGEKKIETSFHVSYKRDESSHISIEIGDSNFNFKFHNENKLLKLHKFNLSLLFDSEIIYLTLFKPNILLGKVETTLIQILLDKESLTLAGGKINFNFPESQIVLKNSAIKIGIPFQLPNGIITLTNLNASIQKPLHDIPSLALNELLAHFDELNVQVVSEHFLKICNFDGSLKSFKDPKFDISLDSINIHYSSLDGLQFFPLVKQLRKPKWTPIRIKFKFPEGHGIIKSLKIKLTMTDLAIVNGRASNVEYKDKKFTFPLVLAYGNNERVGKIFNFGISSPDQEYLTFTADELHLHDRHKINVGWFLRNLIYGWYIIKPWASGNYYDSETIPFPLRITVSKTYLKIDDTPVNKELISLAPIISQFLKEKACMKYIFDSKVNRSSLTDKQKVLAEKKLQELYFQNYSDLCKKLHPHKYIIKLFVTNIDVKLESRNLAPGMENLIYSFDPTTAELHPNTKWRTLEGFKIDATIGTAIVESMKLKKPFVEGSNAKLKGTIIIGEIQGEDIPVKVNVCNQEFTVLASATDVKLYSDLNLMVGNVSWYFGGPALKILDDFADAIVGLIPVNPLDPSPQLRWWDMLRNIFRGRYTGFVNTFITYLIAGNYLNEQDDVAVVIVNSCHVNVSEGLIKADCKFVNMTRKIDGPMILHLPNLTVECMIKWKSLSDNPHKHLIIPDVSRFNEPDYDTFEEFRATEYEWDFLIFFTNDKTVSPFITIDIAHLLWLYEPIKNLYDGSKLNEAYERKTHFKKKERRAKLYYFGRVPGVYKCKMNNVPMLCLRAFDHFPVKNYHINGTSIDISLVKFNLDMTLNLRVYKCPKIEGSIESKGLLFDCTDLKLYSRFKSELSPTFLMIDDIVCSYIEDKIKASVSKIKFAFNQLNIKYLTEYIDAVLHFLPDLTSSLSTPKPSSQSNTQKIKDEQSLNSSTNKNSSRTENKKENTPEDPDFLSRLINRRNEEKVITTKRAEENRINSQMKKSKLENFTTSVCVMVVPSIEILVESMQYDARILAALSAITIHVDKDEKQDLYSCQLRAQSLSIFESAGIYESGPDQKDDELIKIISMEFQSYQKLNKSNVKDIYREIGVSFINLNVSPHEIALIRHMLSEVEPTDTNFKNSSRVAAAAMGKDDDDENNQDNDENNLTPISFLRVTVNQCKGLIQDQNKVSIGSLQMDEIGFKSEQRKGGNFNLTALIKDIDINDIRPGVVRSEVFKRWTSQADNNLNSPIIRFQSKLSPPVGGVKIFNHLEINLDPTIVNYEGPFFYTLISLVLSKEVKRPIFSKMYSNYFQKEDIFLPKVEVDKEKLPIVADASKFMEENKSTEIIVKTDKGDVHMMLRYFKITSTKLNVSYHDSESKIPDINEFNALFHEIRYQDFNATIETLIQRLISDISSDMIPQFLKHMIGLGKIADSEEATLKMWLQNDHDKQSDRQKSMLFGKNKKPTK